MQRSALLLVVLLVELSSPAYAEPRDVLRDCENLLARAADPKANVDKPSDADIARCRQVVRDWTLRESRMLVDEQGRPMR